MSRAPLSTAGYEIAVPATIPVKASSGSIPKRANPKRLLRTSGPYRLKMNPEIPNTIIPASTMSGRLNASPATAAWKATLSSTEK